MAQGGSDRRRAERHDVYIGAEIETESGKVRSAVTEDASTTGLLLLTRARLQPGQRVKLRIFLGPDKTPREASGRVVRNEPLDPEESSLWREKVAVALDEPVPDVARTLAELAAKQAEIYGPRKNGGSER